MIHISHIKSEVLDVILYDFIHFKVSMHHGLKLSKKTEKRTDLLG